MPYDDRHKMFLQVLMQRGIIENEEIKRLIIRLFDSHEILPIIDEINKQLQPISMMIKSTTCEVSCQVYWVVTSTVLSEITRFQVDFTKAQLELLRQIFSQIITSTNGSVSSIFCLNLCSTLEIPLSKADAKEFLNGIVEGKWLFLKDGRYYIGPRSIAELMPYFRTTYENVFNTCSLCEQVIFHGASCMHCTNLAHVFCLKKYAVVQNEEKLICPKCNNSISTDGDAPDIPLTNQNNNEETMDMDQS